MNGTSGFEEVQSSTPDHQPIGSCTSNSINSEQVSGIFSVRTISSLSPQAFARSMKRLLTPFSTPTIVLLFVLIHAFLFGPPEDLVLAQTPTATLDWIEVTQAIQDLNNSVPLIAGKVTLVRAYLTLNSGSSPSPLKEGKLVVQPSSGPPIIINLINSPFLTNQSQIGPKRLNLNATLNFFLPLLPAGQYQLAIDNSLINHDGWTIPCTNCTTQRPMALLQSPKLKIVLVPVIYKSDTDPTFKTDEPQNKEYDLIRSWIKRAYPIASDPSLLKIDDERNDLLEINVDDLSESDPQKSAESNYLKATADVTNAVVKTDRLLMENLLSTHYVGVVSDHNPNGTTGNAEYFKAGKTTIMGYPQPALQDYFGQPGSVATGQRGLAKPPWATILGGNATYWDSDGSYGDWYIGHELGHTLGRPHAIGSGGTSNTLCDTSLEDPEPLPPGHPNGQLSDSTNTFIGYDSGDVALQISPQLLPGPQWHDVMTYCVKQWLSDVTYNEIRCRLHVENGEPCPAPPGPDSTPPAAPTNLRISDVQNNGISSNVHSVRFVGQQKMVIVAAQEEWTAAVRTAETSDLPELAGSEKQPTEYLSILATVNIKNGTGKIVRIAHVGRKPTDVGQKDSTAQIQFLDKNRTVIASPFAVTVPTNAHSLSLNGQTDWVTVEVPRPAGIDTIQLLIKGIVVDLRVVSPNPPTVSNIHRADPQEETIPGDSVVFAWDADDIDKNTPAFAKDRLTYSVGLSRDSGATWKTIAVMLRNQKHAVPLKRLTGISAVMVRVTADDGFNTTTTTSPLIKLENKAAHPKLPPLDVK